MTTRSAIFNPIWAGVVIFTTTGAAILLPLRLIFPGLPIPGSGLVQWAIAIVFLVDLIINGIRLRHHPERLQIQLLITDLVATIPFDIVTGLPAFSLLRLTKLVRVTAHMVDWRHRHLNHWNVLQLVYFVYWVALGVHWLVSGWIAIRGGTGVLGPGTVYLHALYWCVATLTTVGYGDITPVTNAEIFYAMLVMVLGVAMYGYLIGHIANILANINPARARYQESMQKLTAFMSYRGIPDRLRRRIRDYHTYIWGQRLGYDESTILDGLPPSLLTEVSLFLKRDIIHKVPFFKEANDDLIREIALEMRPLVFMPGDIVFREGDQGKGMYFISRGRLEVLSGDGKQVLAVLSDGDIFGETALLRGQPRNASVRAVGYCDLYTLDKHSFDRILTDYPEFAAHLEAMTRVREGRGP